MPDTHPNAYRVEAAEKRTQAIQLNNEADALDAQADKLERDLGLPLTTPPTPEDQLPPGGSTYDPETETQTETKGKSKVPFKK